jgi:hypothetical protein
MTPGCTLNRSRHRKAHRLCLGVALSVLAVVPMTTRADTVASLLGDFTINQYCGLRLTEDSVAVRYTVNCPRCASCMQPTRMATVLRHKRNGMPTQSIWRRASQRS